MLPSLRLIPPAQEDAFLPLSLLTVLPSSPLPQCPLCEKKPSKPSSPYAGGGRKKYSENLDICMVWINGEKFFLISLQVSSSVPSSLIITHWHADKCRWFASSFFSSFHCIGHLLLCPVHCAHKERRRRGVYIKRWAKQPGCRARHGTKAFSKATVTEWLHKYWNLFHIFLTCSIRQKFCQLFFSLLLGSSCLTFTRKQQGQMSFFFLSVSLSACGPQFSFPFSMASSSFFFVPFWKRRRRRKEEMDVGVNERVDLLSAPHKRERGEEGEKRTVEPRKKRTKKSNPRWFLIRLFLNNVIRLF